MNEKKIPTIHLREIPCVLCKESSLCVSFNKDPHSDTISICITCLKTLIQKISKHTVKNWLKAAQKKLL